MARSLYIIVTGFTIENASYVFINIINNMRGSPFSVFSLVEETHFPSFTMTFTTSSHSFLLRHYCLLCKRFGDLIGSLNFVPAVAEELLAVSV